MEVKPTVFDLHRMANNLYYYPKFFENPFSGDYEIKFLESIQELFNKLRLSIDSIINLSDDRERKMLAELVGLVISLMNIEIPSRGRVQDLFFSESVEILPQMLQPEK